ncbi:hypothetical protein NDA11_007701 [Ustilago hordei]|nr:hypothetical protein NDA10_002638 [Ustilago hordei]KAJ1593354.1 hypothetical protein NDA11_007701 [Ustilago hordei]
MADAGQPCCSCKHDKPLSSFIHQHFLGRVTASCLDCCTRLPQSTHTPSQAPSQVPSLYLAPCPPAAFLATIQDLTPQAPATTPVEPTLPTPASPLIAPQPLPPIPDPPSSAAPALSVASDHNFVTHSDFSASIGELRQFLQDEIITTVHLIASPLPPSPPVTTPRPSNPTYTASTQFAAPPAPPPAAPRPALCHRDGWPAQEN